MSGSGGVDDSAVASAPTDVASGPPLGAMTRLGVYVLEHKLGEGAMGAVYRARHSKLGRLVAIKVIRAELAKDPELIRRFLTEARAAAQIRSRETIQVTDYGEENGLCYLVMELVEGETLDRLLQREGPLSSERATRTILAVARGLRDALRAGVIHRDVKPPNIMVSTSGEVKLADLGLAKFVTGEHARVDGGTQTGVGMGTPGYMPPEQYTDAARADERSDIFALGASFHQLLTGELPFAGRTAVEVFGSMMSGPPSPLPADIQGLLGPIVEKMLQRSPADRYPGYEPLIADLERTLVPEPGRSSDSDGASTSPMASRVKPPWGAIRVGSAVVLSVALVGSWLALTDEHREPESSAVVLQAGTNSELPGLPSGLASAVVPSLPSGLQVEAVGPAVQAALQLAYSAPRPGAAPNAAVSVLGRSVGGEWRMLQDGAQLSSADDYKAMVHPELEAHLYAFQIDSRGKLDVLFPRVSSAPYSTGSNPLPAGRWASVPSGAEGLHLDDNLGVEHLYLVLTLAPWPELEQALERALRPMRPSVVDVPFGLKTRGVGGVTRVRSPLPAGSAPHAEKVELLLQGSEGALVVERWFRHIAPPTSGRH